MSRPPAATLQIVALDAYHSRLLASMLDRLNARLHRSWSTSESEPGDATLIDIDDERGRRHARDALDHGRGARTIAFGNGSDFATCHRVAKPLRLAPLLTALSAIEADPDTAWAGSANGFRLLDWPTSAADAPSTNTLRACALLARRPLGIEGVADLLAMDRAEAHAIVMDLCARGLAAPQAAETTHSRLPPAASGLRSLAATLLRRFGI